jgi:hypothetical protein
LIRLQLASLIGDLGASNTAMARETARTNERTASTTRRRHGETGKREPNLCHVAIWAHGKGLIQLPRVDPHRVLARTFARACQQDYIVDENGEPVRRRHAVKVVVGDEQLTFWPNMEDLSPAKMRASLGSRRKGSGEDILPIERDKRYFNKHYNPGDPLEMDYNYNIDVEEHFMPTDYPDAPPEEDNDKAD